jgi:glycosyltransferase involved in cell wall biosynthesis
MRVLILTTIYGPNVGGVETHLDDLIKVGIQKKHYFNIITYQPLITNVKGKYKELGIGYQVTRVPWPRFNLFLRLEKYPVLEFLYLFPGLFLYGLYFMSCYSKSVDIIHAQGLVAGTAGVILGKIFNKKILVSTHSIYHFPPKSLYRKFVRIVLNGSNQVLTLSKQSKKEIVKIGVDEKKISIFINWVDQNRFSPISKITARKKIKIDREKFICLFVGRLVEVKGIRELLTAAKMIQNKKNILFMVIGDGPLAHEVKQAENELNNLVFIGKIDNQKLPIFYNAADVLIVPSTHEEGFGRVMIEALSCGIPVIGSRRGAIPDIINASIGELIDVSPINIVKVVKKFHRLQDSLKKMSREARKYTRTFYSSKNIDMILNHYV